MTNLYFHFIKQQKTAYSFIINPVQMSILGIDLGGTKLATALFSEAGMLLSKETVPLDHRTGAAVGQLITDQVRKAIAAEGKELRAIGVSVPGISHHLEGTVWAPNIPGWDNYPLLKEIRQVA